MTHYDPNEDLSELTNKVLRGRIKKARRRLESHLKVLEKSDDLDERISRFKRATIRIELMRKYGEELSQRHEPEQGPCLCNQPMFYGQRTIEEAASWEERVEMNRPQE